MELLFKNARGVKLIFRNDFEKGSEKKTFITIVYSLTLEVIGIFLKYRLCLIMTSGASQKILIIKK